MFLQKDARSGFLILQVIFDIFKNVSEILLNILKNISKTFF